MTYIFNKNHNRTHLPGCRAIGMMNRAKNEIEVDEPRGNLCGWCFGKKDKLSQVADHCLDEYLAREGT